jgi:hypothetical protein
MFPAPQPQQQRAPEQAQPQQQGGTPTFPVGGGQQGAPKEQQVMESYAKAVNAMAEAAKQVMQIQAMIDPEGQALLVPIAQSGKALEARIKEMAQRRQAGPGAASQANEAGGGSPAPNPAEGATPTAMAA